MFTDEEIGDWIIEGSSDLATTGLVCVSSDTVTLATGTGAYTALTTGGVGGVAKVVMVLWATYDVASTNKGLMRIDPLKFGRMPNKTAGEPDGYCHLGANFYVYPLPAASQNGKFVTVQVCNSADAITDIPNQYQHLPIWYATSMALAKARRGAEANWWMTRYQAAVYAARNTVLGIPPNSLDQLTIPNRTVQGQ
jgi:hypothetical protein